MLIKKMTNITIIIVSFLHNYNDYGKVLKFWMITFFIKLFNFKYYFIKLNNFKF
jgi:hypothetical protein